MFRRMALSLLALASLTTLAEELPQTTWEIDRKVDLMTDVRKCTIRAKDKDVTPVFVLRSDADWLFIVSNSDFPGKTVRARVDKNVAFTGEEDLSAAQDRQLIKQIRAGGIRLLTESYEWPNDYPIVRAFLLEGLLPQMDECARWMRSGDAP